MKKRYSSAAAACAMIAAAGIFMYSASLSAQSDDEKAKEHYKQGVALFQEENYKMAVAEFLRSIELKPNWKLRLTIGICFFNLNRFIDARNELLAYMEEGGDNVPDDKMEQAKDLLTQISKLLAEVKVETNVEGAIVFIDDKKIAETPMKPFAIEAGAYELRIEAPGYKPYVKNLNLAGGDSKFLDVTLIKKSGGEVKEEKGEKVGKEEKEGKEEKTDKPKKKKLDGYGIGGIVLGALALGAAAGTIALGVMVQDHEDELKKCKEGDPPGCDQKDIADAGETYRNTLNYGMLPSLAVFSVGAIALGLVSALLPRKGDKKKTSYFSPQINTIGLGPASQDGTGMGLAIGGTF
ncbi:MAG: PEGA domain-containing protein [Pseudomonadota bacterium]